MRSTYHVAMNRRKFLTIPAIAALPAPDVRARELHLVVAERGLYEPFEDEAKRVMVADVEWVTGDHIPFLVSTGDVEWRGPFDRVWVDIPAGMVECVSFFLGEKVWPKLAPGVLAPEGWVAASRGGPRFYIEATRDREAIEDYLGAGLVRSLGRA